MDKEVNAFPERISQKLNIMVQSEFELASNDFTVHHFNHYAKGPSLLFWTHMHVLVCTSTPGDIKVKMYI